MLLVMRIEDRGATALGIRISGTIYKDGGVSEALYHQRFRNQGFGDLVARGRLGLESKFPFDISRRHGDIGGVGAPRQRHPKCISPL